MEMTNLPSEEEIEKKWKAQMAFSLIKNGKIPERRTLIRNLFYLSGLGEIYGFVKQTGETFHKKKISIISMINFNLENEGHFDFIYLKLHAVLNRYVSGLEIYICKDFFNCIKICYDKNIKWHLIDFDLINFHNSNIKLKNHIPYIVDMRVFSQIHDFLDSFKEQKKIKKYIDFLQEKGYKILDSNNNIVNL